MTSNSNNSETDSLVESLPTVDLVEQSLQTSSTATLAAIPGIGGSLAVMFSDAYQLKEKLDQRQWLERVATIVDDLAAQRRLTPEELVDDKYFRAALMKYLRLARETAREEKLQILAFAACNSGSWSSNPQAVSDYFGRVLERYTPEHVFVLRAFDDPGAYLEAYGARSGNRKLHWIFQNIVFDGVMEWDLLAPVILRDLYTDGFLPDALGLGYEFADPGYKLSSPRGHDFILHCSSPVSGGQNGADRG